MTLAEALKVLESAPDTYPYQACITTLDGEHWSILVIHRDVFDVQANDGGISEFVDPGDYSDFVQAVRAEAV